MPALTKPADGVHTDLYIDGCWRAATDGTRMQVQDPSTGGILAEVASGTKEDALTAVAAAHRALLPWSTTAPRHRSEILRRTYELMVARGQDLATLIVQENGKALSDAQAEVAYAAEFFRWYAEEAVRIAGTVQNAPSGTHRILVQHQPVGVCVLVTPWNFPAAMATRKIGPALAAGCTVILKPSSETPLTALAMADLLEEAGVPAGVVNVLPAKRSGAVVSAMLADPRVRKLSFTGSTEVGRVLLHHAADSVVNCSMELGGNAPFLILADADLDAAVEGAMVAKMRNAGEACTAANRFYVHRSVADQFTERLTVAMSSLRVGPGLDPGVQVGPLVNNSSREKVANLVRSAVDSGASVALGASAPEGPGFFYSPTVLVDVTADAPILRHEIFGPVAPIVVFDSIDDAVRLANDTEYGLVSYLYTRDLALGLRVSEALESGMVGLNRGLVSDPAAPFGGVKQSGVGREGGHEGVIDYTECKYVAVAW